MAQQVTPVSIGADVDSRYIHIAYYGSKQSCQIDNQRTAIRRWLRSLSGPVSLAVEATGCYHLELVDQAHAAGVEVYLIDPYRLSRYRQGVGERNKTDQVDARLLARYLAHERTELRAYQPLSADHRRAWSLLKRRAKLVQAEGMVSESMRAVGGLKAQLKALKQRFARLRQAIDRELAQQIHKLGLHDEYQRCQSIKGVGALTAAALVLAFHRGDFSRADAFVAFLGMDVRVRRSGRYEGQSKLTKKGDAECRRLLHNAARAAARGDLKPYYERLQARGLATTQAHVAVARKLVRIAFSLLKHQSTYDPAKLKMA
jgi:transposase